MPKSRRPKSEFRMKRVPEDLAKEIDHYVDTAIERKLPKMTFEGAMAYLIRKALDAENNRSVAA